MSKVKLSFSFLLSIVLVGMLSVVAFAAVPANAPVNVKFSWGEAKEVTVSWKAVTDAVSYDVTLDGGAVENVTTTSITLEQVDPALAHTVTITPKGSGAEVGPVTTKAVPQITDRANPAFLNANQTGTPDLNKAHKDINGDHDQTVHGSYKNNTNSCASCHQTHTGADTYFLFKNGTYETCNACHDGTMGFYDTGAHSNAGVFNGDAANSGKSIHNANGAVNISAAPGGDTSGLSSSKWGGEFTCTSCHSPHGSDSDRILVSDPMGWGTVEHTTATTAGKLGTKYTGIRLYDVADVSVAANLPQSKADDKDDYILVRTTVDTTKAPFTGNAKFAGVPNGSDIVLTYKWDTKDMKYLVDYSLWLKANTKIGLAKIWDVDKAADFTVNYKEGYAYSTGADTTVDTLTPGISNVTASFGIAVDMSESFTTINNTQVSTVDNRGYFDTANTSGKYIADSGAQMSKFCSACHNDYLATGHSSITGINTQAYRHRTQYDGYTCVRCHFAHGTEAELMKDSLDRGITELTAGGGLYDGNVPAATEYLTDQNPTSALKRYVGMAVCYSCHDDNIVNDTSTQTTTDMTHNPGIGVGTAGN